jgi:hypothetical protein
MLSHDTAARWIAAPDQPTARVKGRVKTCGQEDSKSKAGVSRLMGRRKHFVPCDPPKLRARPRKPAEEKRARKTETQRHRREGERMAGEFLTDAV